MSDTTLAEKLQFLKQSNAAAAAEIASSAVVVDQAITQESGGVVTKPLPPADYTAKLGTDDVSVLLTWTDTLENGDAYQIEGLPALAADSSSYAILGLAQGNTYTVPRIRRIGSEENSDWVTAIPATIDVPASVIVIPDPPVGEYQGPPQGATTIPFDADLTRLAPGDYAMSPGKRVKDFMGLKVGVKLYSIAQYGVEYNGPGLIFNMVGNQISGVRFRGIGQKTKLNDYAGGLVGDNSVISWCEFTDAVGVAAAFGFKGNQGKISSASNAGCFNNRFINCGSAGFGGKAKNSEVAFNYFDGNNAKVGDTDGAGAGKFTRSDGLYFHDNAIKNGTGTMVWWDIENKRCRCSNNTLDGCKKLKDEFRQRGIVFEWSEDGPFEISNNTIRNVAVAVVVEETTGMVVQNNTFFRVNYSPTVATELHLRDYWEGRDGWTPNKRLKNLSVVGNKRGEDGKTEILVARSDSGTKFTPAMLASWGCTFQPECRFAF